MKMKQESLLWEVRARFLMGCCQKLEYFVVAVMSITSSNTSHLLITLEYITQTSKEVSQPKSWYPRMNGFKRWLWHISPMLLLHWEMKHFMHSRVNEVLPSGGAVSSP